MRQTNDSTAPYQPKQKYKNLRLPVLQPIISREECSSVYRQSYIQQTYSLPTSHDIFWVLDIGILFSKV